MAKAIQASAVLEFVFRNKCDAEAVRVAIAPERKLPSPVRCEVRISRRENVLCLRVESPDTAALRAALNSFVRWVMVARDMVEKGGK
ncbi:MAG: hypothetical protein DRN83_00890 [Hadesarchaea archaeon]|nr:MAG: hypothetical protein DRN83_00890 [Hadesarchaea archaeon]